MQQSTISVFEETEEDFFNRIEACGDKGNIISSNRERSFLRNFFLLSEFLCQSYCLVLRKQFANTLFVEFAR